MSDAKATIQQLRDSVCAVMKIKKGIIDKGVQQFQLGFVGTAWCIKADRYLVTAHHLLNEGKMRDPSDRFYAFTVPGNGLQAFECPIVNFPLEDPSNDLAVLEIGRFISQNQHLSAVPVTFAHPADGTPVLTLGFPSPQIANANVAPDGNYRGGQFFLKAHSNTGIVAAQYEAAGSWQFEFNVGWHHGESGGPITQLEPLGVFAVMQSYRNIVTPHGIVAGPHMGRALEVIKPQLVLYGATVI